jgi:transposase
MVSYIDYLLTCLEVSMRGEDQQQSALFSYISPEARVPQDHPLRAIKKMTDDALARLSPLFSQLYSSTGRPSIPPEKLLRALVLQILYTVRSERLLMEQLNYNLLFRWFVGLNMDEAVWDVTVFTKNRERLVRGEVSKCFFEEVVAQAWERGLLSDEHFTVDGTQLEAWAGLKSFKPKGTDGGSSGSGGEKNPTVDFHGEKRSNETHESTTDPQSRLYRKGKGKEAKLSYLGHAVMEHRNALIVGVGATQATGRAERETALELLDEIPRATHGTIAGDKGFDTQDFVARLRERNLVPHVAQNTSGRSSAIDGRTTRHSGYAVSQVIRKRVEEAFGWIKTVGMMRKLRHRGLRRVDWMFTLAIAAYDLVRMRKLLEVTG